MAALGESFGRGVMTNHWIDIKNSDCIMVIGANPAENHPISFKWVLHAMDNGAKLIVVDPRFTRSASKAHIYAPMRSGTDIAFIGGMINYVLSKELYNKECVVNYTNAGFLINPNFKFEDGTFSGFNPEKKAYADKSSWAYQLDEDGLPKIDRTLQNPNCVFQLLKKHFARYDAGTVSKVTGTPKDVFLSVCETFAQTGKPGKAGNILYAMGTTQHTYGSQNIKAYSILQLLLGNIGVAGGGIQAMRGESNVQGSTDMGLLFHILTGYNPAPTVDHPDLKTYLEKNVPQSKDPKSANWWQNRPKYIVSMLKAWFADKATAENEFCFSYLPKADGNYSWLSLFEALYNKNIKGMFLWGQNPAVGGPNASRAKYALRNLEWMVAVDLWETETAAFWKEPGVDPASINTEVFMLPAAASYEKEGSISNSGRWVQWRYKAVDAPDDAKDDLWIMNQIALRLKKLYAAGGKFPEPIVNLNWDYGTEHPDVHKVAKEVNGYALKDFNYKVLGVEKEAKAGEQLPAFTALQADGSTACGNWVYCGSYTKGTPDGNMMARRDLTDAPNKIGLYPKWSWCWPANRRIVYNRASCDQTGKPYDKERWVVRWNPALNEGKGGWEGDVPDGPWAPEEKYPFIMLPEGHARFFGSGLADGPFPEHYEPMESPVKNAISGQQNTPCVFIYEPKCTEGVCPPGIFGEPEEFPIVATTYRLTEHWQAGAMTRNLPWLNELQPEPFVEISEELAAEKGIKNGDTVRVVTIRGSVTMKACVTKRFKPFSVDGKTVHEIGVIWHWGYCGGSKGASANELTPNVGDVNTRIPEFKAFLCNVKKA